MSARTILDEPVSPARLGVIRAGVFGMWLIEVVPDPLSFWGELPRSMHQPVGVFTLIPEQAWNRLLASQRLKRLQGVTTAMLVLSTLGVRPYRPIALSTAALLTGHQAVVRAFTFTNHEELALLACTYVLAIFPAADGFAWPGRRRPTAPPSTYAAAVHGMSLLLLLPYCEIAARRLVRGAPDVFTGDSVPHWLASLDSLDRETVGIGPWLLAHPRLVTFLKAGFAVTTVFELIGPLCLIMPRLRRPWIVIIASMHLLNRATMKLFFWHNTALILLLLSGGEQSTGRAWAQRARRWRSTSRGCRRNPLGRR